jgi:hypothetical protein
MNKRIDFIDSFFSPTLCVFEKIILQRYIYFFIFNVACTLSEAFHSESISQKTIEMQECTKN